MIVCMGGNIRTLMWTHADSSGLLERSSYKESAWLRSLYLRVCISSYDISRRRSLRVRVRIGAKSL